MVATLIVSACAGTTIQPLGLPPPSLVASPVASGSAVPGVASPRDQVRTVVSRYFEVLNRLHLDMGYAALTRLFTPDCPCQVQVRAIRSAAARGERYDDRVRVIALRVNIDGPQVADVLADYQVLRGGLVDAAGHRLTRNPAHRIRWDFQLRRDAKVWRIARIEDLS